MAQDRRDTLARMAEEHNSDHGSKGRVTVDMLEAVFDRGVGAYRTNPSSVRPNVKSPEQWAYARVKNFLRTIRTGRFRSGQHDTDLLPKQHPLSTRKAAVNLMPTEGMKAEAKRYREWKRQGHGGGTRVAAVRAAQILSGRPMSAQTVKVMRAWFARHEVDKQGKGFSPGEDGYPSNGRVAWAAWGGDAGKAWAEEKMRQIENQAEKSFQSSANVLKVDDNLGLVLGWAVVCKVEDTEYFDTQGDHIPEDAMLKAATDFMLNSRTAGDMHAKADGKIVFCWPMTSDIAKAFGFTTKQTGLLVAMKPDSPEILAKFRSGEYTGFSIGGRRVQDEVVN